MSSGNQVEKPRFFIDLLNYQYHIGNITNMSLQANAGIINTRVLGLNPTIKYEMDDTLNYYRHFYINFKNPISLPPNTEMFIAVLGHDHKTQDNRFKFRLQQETQENNQDGYTEIINGSPVGASIYPSYDGWSLLKFTPSVVDEIIAVNFPTFRASSQSPPFLERFGGLAFGFIYEPEFHADLAVTQSRIMDGVKQKQTKGGNTYSIINYTKPPNWWTGSPFELTDASDSAAYSNARIGRRSWDIGFSQLSDRFYTNGNPNGVFPANEMISNVLPDTVNGNYSANEDYDSASGTFNYNINNDTSLYSTLYHHTLGGTLPFLFSPSQDNSPQNFAICRFDKPGFKVTQKSHKKFNIKMKINESW